MMQHSRKSPKKHPSRRRMSQEEHEEEVEDGPYKCCGRLVVDFPRVCAKRGLPYAPEVVPRAVPPCRQHLNVLGSKALAQASSQASSPKKVVKEESVSKAKKATGSRAASRRDSALSVHGAGTKKHSVMASLQTSISTPAVPPQPPQPKTFVLKDNTQMRQPRVQVEQEVADDDRTVTEVHVRDWKVDEPMMGALTQCLMALSSLHTLQLWNAGLDFSAVESLAAGLPGCPRLSVLVLDNNPLRSLPVWLLLAPGSPLQSLSLRWCGITHVEAEHVALALGSPPQITGDGGGGSDRASISIENKLICSSSDDSNTTLLSLNLSGNRVGNAGACHLAEALKLNRTLLVLNLTANGVGDAGALALAEALSWFRVGEELQRVRRAMVHEMLARHLLPSLETDQVSVGELTGKRGSHSAGFSRMLFATGSSSSPERLLKKDGGLEKKRGSPARHKKSQDMTAEARLRHYRLKRRKMLDKPVFDPELSVSGPTTRPSWLRREQQEEEEGGGGSRRRKEEGEEKTSREVLSYQEVGREERHHPLLQAGYIHGAQMWLPGNRTLLSLNLSRNEVGEEGVGALLDAVREQGLGFVDGKERGLRRLVLSRNAFGAGSPAAKALGHLMAVRDPLARYPIIDLCKSFISPCAIPVCPVF